MIWKKVIVSEIMNCSNFNFIFSSKKLVARAWALRRTTLNLVYWRSLRLNFLFMRRSQ